MAALHETLKTLSPVSFLDIPIEESNFTTYLQNIFSQSQLLIDSVPPPPIEASLISARSRANTSVSIASNASEMSTSSARPDPPMPEHANLQKEWGKPIKLSAKDNPMGMGVYKLSGKDGNGAWFARRSVHEGLAFSKWKEALQREFPESLKVQGGPGQGNIRGIGGERRVELRECDGVGTMEVYHLSAQFPGPTTPRDFVTLLLTSSSALPALQIRPSTPRQGNFSELQRHGEPPRHFVVISKPCNHPECPERDGFIRGRYESVEFIREIPSRLKKSSSTTDITNFRKPSFVDAAETDGISESSDGHIRPGHNRQISSGSFTGEGRSRGKTISFAESRGVKAKGENLDRSQESEEPLNPVEWIMITRSDPGGSVPRFMVERGTPAGIVGDAKKFLDWACKISTHITKPEEATKGVEDKEELPIERYKTAAEIEAPQTNGHLAGLDDDSESSKVPPSMSYSPQLSDDSLKPVQHSGLLSSAANIAYTTLEAYTPQAIRNRLPTFTPSSSALTGSTDVDEVPPASPDPPRSPSPTPSSSATSIASFASADSHLTTSTPSINSKDTAALFTSSNTTTTTPHEKELAKLAARKEMLDAKLAKLKEKETKNKEELTAKEQERLRKAEEKHAREVAKAEEKHAKELAALEHKRKKEQAKEEERRKRAQDKDEKARLQRERDEVREELDMVRSERDILLAQVGELQKQNTVLTIKIGRLEGSGSSPSLASSVSGGLKEIEGGAEGGGSLRVAAISTASSLIPGPVPLVSAGLESKMEIGKADK